MIRNVHRSACLLLLAVLLLGTEPSSAQDGGAARSIRNPYFEKTEWKVWRFDESPVESVQTLVREGKTTKAVETTLEAPAGKARVYPVTPPPDDRFLAYAASPEPSAEHAGIWDDVYTSWSGLHGYVRNRWKGPGGDQAEVLKHIIHFVDVSKQNTLRAGVNFIHQSTTGCAHSIANGYMAKRTEQFERLYFANALFTGPAHASYTEQRADRTSDLYMALFPAIFNSVGSSNSETMAITKMILAGGHLPPDTKRKIKLNGHYPATMLYIWKASLPYPVPYDHELRHRLAYKAVGDRSVYPEKYGAAGIDRGDLCLAYHRYDDAAHMRNMIEMAKGMKSPPPEAVLRVLEVSGGRTVYSLKKSLLVVQEKGEEIGVVVSTADCYDLDDRPVRTRFKLLCGNPDTTVEPEAEPGTFRVTVPWNDALPQGRTSVALIANNGVYDSNPAVINVYRKKGEIPGNGTGPKDYKYPGKFANLRPVLTGLTDRVVKPGEEVTVPIRAIDPEGFPVRLSMRSGQVGGLDGNVLAWSCPKDAKPGTYPVTLIASDGTSGDSYAGETLRFEVAPKIFAKLTAGRLSGPAPLTVQVSAEGSFDTAGKVQAGWEFYAPALKRKAKPFKDQPHGVTANHTFKSPGVYEISLTVKGPSGTDAETVSVLVTGKETPGRPEGIVLSGNDAGIRDGDEVPTAFDHTHFGAVPGGEVREREFLLANLGKDAMEFAGNRSVTLDGPQAGEFSVAKAPRGSVGPGGSTRLRVRFTPTGAGERAARVVIRPKKGSRFTFTVGGFGDIDQEALDRQAEPAFAAARKLFEAEKWEAAEKALRGFVTSWPGATFAAEARKMIERIETDPGIRAAIEKTRAAVAKAAAGAKEERAAKSLWNLAENYRKNGRADLAKKTLETLVRKYPATTWAEKAKEELNR